MLTKRRGPFGPLCGTFSEKYKNTIKVILPLLLSRLNIKRDILKLNEKFSKNYKKKILLPKSCFDFFSLFKISDP